ncbi:LysR substrate-binding domain-containing protein [Lactiplantibacillus plantarum]|uniref:LysR substrate-binding domain-containing protein n=1 Tax=Lactiplantibacillus plantarum TaxID=1590 RepID=UPI001F4CCBC3|nr:LysR substrate-binding domain-containing protein [Lactiplantibacillus plantarum]
MKRLERHFQVTLFFRQAKTKALVLTPSGQQLLLAANDIINNWQHVNESISHLRQHTLRFGIEPSVSEHYLPALTKPIIEQDLLSSVHTVEMGANQLVKQVLAGQLDLAISGNLDQTLDERLAVTPLRPFKFRILANAAHPLAKAEHPTFAEALKSPFVLLNATYLNKLVFRQLAEQLSIEPQVLFESDSSTLIKGLVKENLALGFISDITTPNDGEDDGLVEIPFDDVQVPSVHINLIRRAHQFPIGLVKQVIDIIEKTFAADNAEQKS